jgi:MoxR-like ATPase
LLDNIIIELVKRVKTIHTLTSKKENVITKIDDKGIYVETESSKSKYQSGNKTEPYEFIPFRFLLDGWYEFIDIRHAEANDFKKVRGRTSFLMSLFSHLPFVEVSKGKNTSIRLREFQTDELPNVPYKNVKEFLDEIISGNYNPTQLNEQFEGNLYRIKSASRQDARLLGFINEFNESNQFQLKEYVESEHEDQYIKRILLHLGYFRVVLICLDLLQNYSKSDKKAALEELGMLIVRNSRGENLMVESVSKERTGYLLKWLEHTRLIDNEWTPTEPFFDTLSLKEQKMASDIRSNLLKVMNTYLDAKRESFGGNQLGAFVRNDIPLGFYQLDFIDSSAYVVTGSVGQGNWASVPWIAIMNRKITVSTQRGYYICYLFSEDMNHVYLTFMQGVTETSKEEIAQTKEDIRLSITGSTKIKKDDLIDLGTSQKAKQYAHSTAAYIRYNKQEMPSESGLVADLQEMVTIYENYIASKNRITYEHPTETHSEVHEHEMVKLNDKDLIEHIYSYIRSKGFYYKKEEVINLFLSLKTKPFVILSGISGTGKTKMVQWFAESVGATEENGQFALIPIRPDWNDGSDLLGYVDIKGEFKEGPLTRVIKRAENHPELPYFVLLDEMNLARVEYYFSDILSVMESRKWKDGNIVSTNLLSEEIAGFDLKLPNNLYIVGTVNMDETTHPFSKKVLDRANTIEFNRIALGNLSFLHEQEQVDPIVSDQDSFASTYLHLKDLYVKNNRIVELVTTELERMNAALLLINAHVGYRVRDEICFYMAYNEEARLLEFSEAFDHCILQKILPRIAGSDMRVDQLLKKLYVQFTNKQYEEDVDLTDQELQIAIYPKSATKVVEMLGRLRDDGFTSFWIS